MPVGSAQLIMIRALRPVQFVGVPDKVRIKVSQFTPSTQVLSSRDVPPVAVPVQTTVGPVGLSVPALGVAERRLVVGSANIKKRTLPRKHSVLPTITRTAVTEENFVFIANVEELLRLLIAKNRKSIRERMC